MLPGTALEAASVDMEGSVRVVFLIDGAEPAGFASMFFMGD